MYRKRMMKRRRPMRRKRMMKRKGRQFGYKIGIRM